MGSSAERLAIMNALSSYAWGNDTRDLALLADCFTEDAICSGYVEEQLCWGPIAGRDNIVRELSARVPAEGIRRHHIGSIRFVKVEDGEAHVVSYMVVTHAQDGKATLETTGWYKDTLIGEGDSWRFKEKEWHIDCAV